jgi:Cu2+-exporting ATPase
MHPEIIQEGPACPTCGMDLVPMEPTESEEQSVSWPM